MGNQDGEGVGDDEPTDHDRDHRERDQERRDHGEEFTNGGGVLVDDLLAGRGLETLGQHRLGGLGELVLGHARGGGEANGGVGVLAAEEEFLGSAGVQHHQRGASGAAVVEVRQTDQFEPLGEVAVAPLGACAAGGMTLTSSPTSYPAFSAERVSSATSPGFVGQRPPSRPRISRPSTLRMSE